MEIIVLQHIKVEDPGYIKDLMIKDGFNLTTIELDKNEKIPKDLNKFDGMFCMGGPMDTWMEKKYPWLVEEKKKIKEFVIDLKKPFLGFCLGCQLLGEVIGGKVIKSKKSEIGMLEINFLKKKENDIIFSTFPEKIKALQWHSYEVVNLENNKDVTLLASSPNTKYQIFKYKNHAYGIQFHMEVDENTIIKWSKVPELKNALEKYLGKNSIDELDILLRNNIQEMNNNTKKLYENFKNLMTT